MAQNFCHWYFDLKQFGCCSQAEIVNYPKNFLYMLCIKKFSMKFSIVKLLEILHAVSNVKMSVKYLNRSQFQSPQCLLACTWKRINGFAAMVATKRLAGIAPEVNLREHISCMPPPSTNKAAYSGFETQRRCHQKSKTVAPQKGLMSSKNFHKKFGEIT